MSPPDLDPEASPISVAAPPAPFVDDRPRPRPVVFVVPALVVGIIVGFLAGLYFGGERIKDEYRSPLITVKANPGNTAVVLASSSASPDPTPPVGARIIASFPLAGARSALSQLTRTDKVVVNVGAVGRGDGGMELHLAISNRGDCTLKAVSGVAYGFDPDGDSTAMNADGKHYVAFSSEDLTLAPGGTSVATWPLKHAKLANVALAQIDKAVCDDGTILVSRSP